MALMEQTRLDLEKLRIENEEKVEVLKAQITTRSRRGSIESDVFGEDTLRKNRTRDWVMQAPAFPEPLFNLPARPVSGIVASGNMPHTSAPDNCALPCLGTDRDPARNGTGLPVTREGGPQTRGVTACVNTPLKPQTLSSVLLDASTRYMAMAELKRPPARPYCGEAHLFRGWVTSLQHRMDPLQLSALDRVDILEAHTAGEARQTVETFKTANLINPDKAYEMIMQNLHRRFGGDEEIVKGLRPRLLSFPEIRGPQSDPSVALQLRQFSDLYLIVLAHIDSVTDLQTLNHAHGVDPLRCKLPEFLNNKWRELKGRHVLEYGAHPKFEVFTNFLVQTADLLCADVTRVGTSESNVDAVLNKVVNSFQTVTSEDFASPLPGFNYGLCYRCLGPHVAANCDKAESCRICNNTNHATVLHQERQASKLNCMTGKMNATHSAAPRGFEADNSGATALCTETSRGTCSPAYGKTVLVEVFSPDPAIQPFKTYAIIDEQSNKSFATSRLLDSLKIVAPASRYTVSTLSRFKSRCVGRAVEGLAIRGFTETKTFMLPRLFENNWIPDTRLDVATPEVVRKCPQIQHLADNFPPVDPNLTVDILIGRDAGNLMPTSVVHNSIPVVHHTMLGWAVVGAVPQSESLLMRSYVDHLSASLQFPPEAPVFTQHLDDEMSGLTMEDKRFLSQLCHNTIVNEKLDQSLPNNCLAFFRRAVSTLGRLKFDPLKLRRCLSSMKNTLPGEETYEHDLASYGARRWRRVQHLAQESWTRWRKEYLQDLQKRQK
ncbi:hypothetical protein HAZT_HAZT010517 [Hyalella azteca]|uniref:Uncharacterized protein n=1 Tax=Hyalella azteca TaxID=294128 RepID=A0A6A0H5N2_HYAAZ|nr:hypothetical protein HAZT_HAZT010517 [Hyalella azteca]